MPNSLTKVRNDLLALGTEERNKVFNEYRASMGLSGGIPSTTSFDNYAAKRISGSAGFSEIKAPGGKKTIEIKAPDGKKIGEKLQGTPAEASIANVMKLTKAAEDKKLSFKKALEELNVLIAIDPPDFDPSTIASYLHGAKGRAVAVIKAQHAHETQALTDLFADATFKNNFKTSMGLTDDTQIEQYKKEMLDVLKISQERELKTFEKSINDTSTKLHQDKTKEFDRISFLGDRYLRNKKMRDEIDALAEKNGANANIPASATINGDTKNATLKGIKVQDLKEIYTITGRPLHKNEDGSYTMQLNRLFNSDKDTYEELASLAQTIRACGHETITLDVNCKDPKRAAELARKAYESAIVAGFDPDKITIRVNGEVKMQYDAKTKKQTDELFKEEPTRLQFAKEKAGEIKKNVGARLDDATTAKAELTRLKKAVHDEEPDIPSPAQPT